MTRTIDFTRPQQISPGPDQAIFPSDMNRSGHLSTYFRKTYAQTGPPSLKPVTENRTIEGNNLQHHDCCTIKFPCLAETYSTLTSLPTLQIFPLQKNISAQEAHRNHITYADLGCSQQHSHYRGGDHTEPGSLTLETLPDNLLTEILSSKYFIGFGTYTEAASQVQSHANVYVYTTVRKIRHKHIKIEQGMPQQTMLNMGSYTYRTTKGKPSRRGTPMENGISSAHK
jgi:hypothetical protein